MLIHLEPVIETAQFSTGINAPRGVVDSGIISCTINQILFISIIALIILCYLF